ncbi:MAG: putative O-methyltransferase [Peptococcaceae bacterium]|jgi:tRNA1Val (adenine37-N6)-methyltransferase|nr:putative O-methyltransferase [Peptococcaceae bacterium]
MDEVIIYPDETLDDLLIQGLRIIQKAKGFRFTLDSVMLSHFATLKEGDRVADLGTGTGIIPLILSTRAKKLKILGVELQPHIAEMALRSVKLNKLEEKIEIVEGDIRNIHKVMGGGQYTLVTANPPYWSVSEGLPSPAETKALSRHEISCSLEDFIASASKLLNYQGRFALIHRADRLMDIIGLLRRYQLEPRRMRLIHPYLGKCAQHVLLEARKSAPPELKVLPPLVVYEAPGRYTPEILRWYGKEEIKGGA